MWKRRAMVLFIQSKTKCQSASGFNTAINTAVAMFISRKHKMNFYKTLSLLISETRVKLRNTYVYGLSVLVKFNA